MLSTTLMRVVSKQRALGISSATISRLAGLRAAALSDALREVSRLTSEQEARVEQVMTRLTALDASVRPFRLPLGSTEVNDLQLIVDSEMTPEELQAAVTRLFQKFQQYQ